jgi:hypothetical protein
VPRSAATGMLGELPVPGRNCQVKIRAEREHGDTIDQDRIVPGMGFDWALHLAEQLDWHWRAQLRPRLDGLTDDEYSREPVPGCWNVRRRDAATASGAPGTGDYTVGFAFPQPDPAPVTTIAWRLAHIIAGVLGMRVAAHFGGPLADYATHRYAGTAAEALRQLDDVYAAWNTGVRGLSEADLMAPCGPAEGPFSGAPMADLILHINRETMHHGAEIALLRDLYLRQAA